MIIYILIFIDYQKHLQTNQIEPIIGQYLSMHISRTNRMRVLSKVKKQASNWFKESVPFWHHNSFISKIVYSRNRFILTVSLQQKMVRKNR